MPQEYGYEVRFTGGNGLSFDKFMLGVNWLKAKPYLKGWRKRVLWLAYMLVTGVKLPYA